MSMLKRWSSPILIGCLALALGACGGAGDEAADTGADPAVVEDAGSESDAASDTASDTGTASDAAASDESDADDDADESGDVDDSDDAEDGDEAGDTDDDDAADDGTDDEDATADDSSAAMSGKLNLNTATSDELMTVPGAGDEMVHEFEEYRPYVSIQQFRREMAKYVDDETIAGYEEYLFVPVDPNESDAETLAQLPGVDETVADALMAARPFATHADFLALLATLVDEADAAMAADYLVEE